MHITMRRLGAILILCWPMLLLGAGAAVSQSAASIQSPFEVSTVKPSVDSPYSSVGYGADSFSAKNATLRTVIEYAYSLGSDHQLVGEPEWVDKLRFDINAKEEESTREKLNSLPLDARIAMGASIVQSLLADRFALRMHHETRDLPALVLVAAKSGPKLKPSQEDPNDKRWSGLHDNGRGHIEGRDVTLQVLASHLGGLSEIDGQTVINKSDLDGKYDFTLDWAPEHKMGAAADSGPSLFTALQEQLGLKLESAKVPVDVLVIDHVEMPKEN